MRKASAASAAIALMLALCTCANHPTITAAVAGGTIGFGGCYIEVEKPGTCSVIGGGAALFLGGLVALVTHFVDTSAHQIPADDELEDYQPRKIVRPDAGIRMQSEAPELDASVGAPASPDAGVVSPAP